MVSKKEIVWGIIIALIFFVTIVSAMALEIKINDNLTDTYLFLPNETGVGGVILSATCEALAFFPRYNTTPYFKRTAVEIGNGIYRFNMTSPNETGTHILYGNCTKSNANFVGALEFEVVVEKTKEIINATRNTSLQTYNAVLSTNYSIMTQLISDIQLRLNNTLLNLSYARNDLSFVLSNQSSIYNLIYNENTSIMKNLNDARTDINLTLLNMINMNITQLEKFNSISNNLTIILNNLSFILNISNCSNSWQSGDWFCNKLFENYKIVNDSNQTLLKIRNDLSFINQTSTSINDSINLLKNKIELEISTYPVFYINDSIPIYYLLKNYLGILVNPDSYNITIRSLNQTNYTWSYSNNATQLTTGVLYTNETLVDALNSGLYIITWNLSLNGYNTSEIRLFRISSSAYDVVTRIINKEVVPGESVFFDTTITNNGNAAEDIILRCWNAYETKESSLLIYPHSTKVFNMELITSKDIERQDTVQCIVNYNQNRQASASDDYNIRFPQKRKMGLITIVREQKYFITPLSLLIVGGIVFGGYYYFGNGKFKKKSKISKD